MSTTGIEDIYTLTPIQQGMLFHSLEAPGSGVYVVQWSFVLEGPLDYNRFQQAWQHVISNHPLLRTACRWEKLSKPVLIVYRHVELPWQVQDWSNVSQIQQEVRLSRWLEQDRTRGFDLAAAPLIHMLLTRIGTKRYRWVWSMHHLLLDGWSSALLLHEILDCYHMLSQGQNPLLVYRRPYRDYLLWLQHLDQTGSDAFWRKYLRGFKTPTTVCLPVTGQAHSSQERFGEATVSLSVETTRALQQLAQQAHVTLNTLVQGAWAILLSRYSGETDVVFGVTLSGRPATLEQVETMVGLFINTLPLRLEVPQNRSIWSWLPEVQSQQVELLTYQHSSLSQIQAQSEIPGGTPLFESIVVFENYPLPTNRGWEHSLSIGDLRVFEQTNYPLSLQVHARQGLTFRLFYSSAKVSASMSHHMLEHLQIMLEHMVAAPQCPIGRLPLLTRTEEQQLLNWNQTQVNYPSQLAIHQLFERQVAERAHAIALVFEDQQLSYAALNRRANQLAHLLQSWKVGPEVRVGLCLPRGGLAMIALLAILKAGGAYVPLDPDYPPQRLEAIMEDAHLALLLTQSTLQARLRAGKVPCRQLVLDVCQQEIAGQSTRNPDSLVSSENLAYIIYTSGSTGRPKGVLVPHKGLNNIVVAQRELLGVNEKQMVAQLASLNFDASVFEWVMAWAQGGTLHVCTQEEQRAGEGLAVFLREEGITIATLSPSVLATLPEEALPDLKRLVLAGEACTEQQVERWGVGRQVFNAYGPTEDTIWSTMGECKRGAGKPLIGRPITNTQVYVLDELMEVVPWGVKGELYVGGAGVARGYEGLAALTAERYVPNPWSERGGERLYRTGDVVRYREDGSLEYVGRKDQQVKLRGFRIELKEIEAVLREEPQVAQAVVLLRHDLGSEPRLVAYLVEQTGQSLQMAAMRERLRERLPSYMVPTSFLLLPALPLTPNGKLDRRALPAPEKTRAALPAPFQGPRTAIEQIIARAWISVLGLDRIGIHDKFFDLGGDSLTSLRVTSLASESGVRITPRQMIEHQTIAQLAKHATLITSTSEGKNITGPLPMLPTQAYYLLSAPDEEPHIFNSLVLLETQRPLELHLLKEALRVLLDYHEALRSRFTQTATGWQASIAEVEKTIPFSQVDLSHLNPAEQKRAIPAEIERLNPTFNLSKGPLLRIVYFTLGELRTGRLLLLIHHFVTDAISLPILGTDFLTIYEHLSQGEPVRLPPKTASIRDFAECVLRYAQTEAMQEVAYWVTPERQHAPDKVLICRSFLAKNHRCR
jgi:amino acid adenylation domain-containing protein